MIKNKDAVSEDLNPQETSEWLESLDEIIDAAGPDRATYLLRKLQSRAAEFGVALPMSLNAPYKNTIPPDQEVPYPGDRAIERRIKNLTPSNALAIVIPPTNYHETICAH